MKKIYFLTLSYLFLSLFTNAQSTYYKMLKEDTTTWQHYGVTFGVANRPVAPLSDPVVDYNSYAALDTISYNGLKYQKLYQLSAYGASITYANKVLKGYLREDTVLKKVYFSSPLFSGDLLLYDFSVAASNTVAFTFPNNSSYSGIYNVDSVVTRTILCGPRKHFYLKKSSGSSEQIEYIEGVGSTYHIAHIFANWQNTLQGNASTPTCTPKWSIGLTCKNDDAVKMYEACVMTGNINPPYAYPPGETCNYTYFYPGGLKSNDNEQLMNIGPNPSNEGFAINMERSYENSSYSVADLTGKVLINEKKTEHTNSIYISTKDLAPGIYMLQVRLNETLIKKPIIVQH
jgi:hypothetical protein